MALFTVKEIEVHHVGDHELIQTTRQLDQVYKCRRCGDWEYRHQDFRGTSCHECNCDKCTI